MHTLSNKLAFLTVLMIFFSSCHVHQTPRFRIGVSQCADGLWRDKMNQELEDELVFHPDMELHFRCAYDRSSLQALQIDSFIAEKVDLLIVSPNETELQPAVERAFDAGIPVIIADRRIPGNKWTAFIGGDNRQVGLNIARWLIQLQTRLDRPIEVLEITGAMTTTPAVLRHEGMIQGLRKEKDIHIVGSLCGFWEKYQAEFLCDSFLIEHPDIDAIVTHNDWMAYGASDAVKRHDSQVLVMGVDGLPGVDNGIEAVIRGQIAATATYPSRGDLIIQRAAQILNHEPFPRETSLPSILVGPDEAYPMANMYKEHQAQMATLKALRQKVINLTNDYNTQRMIIALMSITFILIIVIAIGGYKIVQYRNRVHRERDEKDEQLRRQQDMLRQMSEQFEQSHEIPVAEDEEKIFVDSLTREIEARLSDSEMSVEVLATALGVSRSVLFRRCKSATGLSPIELIRHLRLEHASRLLESGTMTVQQVAYEVGFASPGYFTRCYKERYGVTPGDGKNKS